MNDTTPKAIHLSNSEVDAMRDLYERGQYVQAFHVGARHGSINHWSGLHAQLLGGRIAMNLGGMRLGTAIHLKAGRMYREDATVAPYYVRAILASRGPLAAWHLLRDRSVWSDHNTHAMSDWLCLRAAVLARFRDFSRAEAELEAAKRLATDSPWVLCEQSAVAQHADRYEDALRLAEEALELRPGYRPAIQAAALNLTLLNREEAAMALLTDSVNRIESAALAWQLADLQLQRGLVKQARDSLQRASELALLADKGFTISLACHQGDAAYLDGDFSAARSHYAQIPKSEYHEKLITRLEDASIVPKRVALEVGFTRQHHLTCAPATLATLSRYWNKPVDHLELVDQICYDGTSNEAERRWAEESGWRCREFTVTMEASIAVIDAGVPFTLTTVEPTSGHLQAVIGYDALKQVLLVRDPTWRSTREYPIEWLRERYGASGPRGFVLTPANEWHRIAGIDLPDAPQYDEYHSCLSALMRHDRDSARTAAAELAETWPEHRLTDWARCSIAAYDSADDIALAAIERLLERWPESWLLKLRRLSLLRDLTRPAERLTQLEDIVARPKCPSVFFQQYAQELCRDARSHPQAERFLRRAIEGGEDVAGDLYILAGLRLAQGRPDEALEYSRFAACLSAGREMSWQAYFATSRLIGREDESLNLLAERAEKRLNHSGEPAATFAVALRELGRIDDAIAVLTGAMDRRPGDGALALSAAEFHARLGRLDDAQRLLERAKSRVAELEWCRIAATVFECQGDQAKAAEMSRRVVEINRFDIDAHARTAELLLDSQGVDAVMEFLAGVCERLPHHLPLNRLNAAWLVHHDRPESRACLARLLEAAPNDSWTLLETALLNAQSGAVDEAQALVARAAAIDESTPRVWITRARIELMSGKPAEARESFLRATRTSFAVPEAIDGMLRACETMAQRIECIDRLWQEIVDKRFPGEALMTLQQAASGMMPADHMLMLFESAHAARPEIWSTWNALVLEQLVASRISDALRTAQMAVERFPWQTELWRLLAQVHRARHVPADEVQSLDRAVKTRPGDEELVRELADALSRAGRVAEAVAVLQASSHRAPFDGQTRAALAVAMWKSGRAKQAIECMEQALQHNHRITWGWSALRSWCDATGQSARALTALRETAERCPGDTSLWLMLAEHADTIGERLKSIDRALALRPNDATAIEAKVDVLVAGSRFDEAMQACGTMTSSSGLPSTRHLLLEARVNAKRGDLAAAVSRCDEVLKSDPFNPAALDAARHWLTAQGENVRAVEMASRLVRVIPLDAGVHALLGDALVACQRKKEAVDAYRRSRSLDPENAEVLFSLLRLELESGDHEGARITADAMLSHYGRAAGHLGGLHIAMERRDEHGVESSLAELCRCESQDEWALRNAVSEAVTGGYLQSVNRVLRKSIEAGGANGLVLPLWVNTCCRSHGYFRTWRVLKSRDLSDAHVAQAYCELLGAMSRSRNAALRMTLLRRMRPFAADNDTIWAYYGWALGDVGKFKKECDWFADWRARQKEPWVYRVLASAFATAGRIDECHAVLQEAMTLPRNDETIFFEIRLALELALRGEVEAARAHIARVNSANLKPGYQIALGLANAVMLAWEGSRAGTPDWFRKTRKAVADTVDYRMAHMHFEDVRANHDRCIDVISRLRGGIIGRLWKVMRWCDSRLPRDKSSLVPSR